MVLVALGGAVALGLRAPSPRGQAVTARGVSCGFQGHSDVPKGWYVSLTEQLGDTPGHACPTTCLGDRSPGLLVVPPSSLGGCFLQTLLGISRSRSLLCRGDRTASRWWDPRCPGQEGPVLWSPLPQHRGCLFRGFL